MMTEEEGNIHPQILVKFTLVSARDQMCCACVHFEAEAAFDVKHNIFLTVWL